MITTIGAEIILRKIFVSLLLTASHMLFASAVLGNECIAIETPNHTSR